MNVIPVINCSDISCVAEKIEAAKTFLPNDGMLHLDITDGVFSSHDTWHDAEGWTELSPPFPLEAHFMVVHPGIYIEEWIQAGAKRCIVHVETMNPDLADKLLAVAKQKNVSLMLSSNPETPAETITPYIGRFEAFQVLAVHPGAAGQEFNASALEKIKFLRGRAPRATIEVDGGMNPETAKMVKAAGADTIVSETYIFETGDPRSAYETLRNI